MQHARLKTYIAHLKDSPQSAATRVVIVSLTVAHCKKRFIRLRYDMLCQKPTVTHALVMSQECDSQILSLGASW